MKPNINLPLAIGLILNLVRLLIIHSKAEVWLRENWRLPTWFWHFVGGAAAALMLLGLVLLMKPERLAACKQWFIHFLGG